MEQERPFKSFSLTSGINRYQLSWMLLLPPIELGLSTPHRYKARASSKRLMVQIKRPAHQ
jgi:hypothetical protein